MPVTFRLNSFGATPITNASQLSAQDLFDRSCEQESNMCAEILQSSLGRGASAQSSTPLLPASSGLVSTISEAYNLHRALVLRPDDIWLAILNQFHLFVNAHAEELRDKFVAHEGKKKIVITASGTRYTVDFGGMATQMTSAMDEFIIDPSLRQWIIPRFSTTTDNDRVTAAVCMMATLKNYFDYSFMTLCGIPQVTLEGEIEDWEEILRRAAKLEEYGNETKRWYGLLQPVLTRFVRAFKEPNSAANTEFWGKVLSYQSMGSGPTYMSGWITAFCFFGKHGETKHLRTPEMSFRPWDHNGYLTLDGVVYPHMDTSDIPRGYAEVDVHLNDNGEQFETKMVAGIVASRIVHSNDTSLSKGGRDDTVAPFPGWWIYVHSEDKESLSDSDRSEPSLDEE